jgi:hypothetical protein
MNTQQEMKNESHVTGITDQSKALIARFEASLASKLKAKMFSSEYNSLDEILTKKYNLSDLVNMDFPDFQNKTEFIVKAVRGNIAKAEGKILSYAEGETIIEKGLNTEMP